MLETRPLRAIAAIQGKFERLDNTKKPTGDPSCLPTVQRAKLIEPEFLKKVNAFSLVDSRNVEGDRKDGYAGRDEDEDEDEDGDEPASEGRIRRAGSVPVGTRNFKHKAGAGGVKVSGSTQDNEDMLQHMEVIEKSVSSLVEVLQKESDGVSTSLKCNPSVNKGAHSAPSPTLGFPPDFLRRSSDADFIKHG